MINALHLMEGQYDDPCTMAINKSLNIKIKSVIWGTGFKELSFVLLHMNQMQRAYRRLSNSTLWTRLFDFIDIKEISKITPTCQYLKDDCIIILNGHQLLQLVLQHCVHDNLYVLEFYRNTQALRVVNLLYQPSTKGNCRQNNTDYHAVR